MRREVEDIKYRLCDELAEYADKNRWTEKDVEMIDHITHSIKSLMKYIEMEENGGAYEGRSYARGRYNNRYYRDDRSYDNRYYDDHSYDNSYRGRSRDDGMEEMTHELEELMAQTSDADVKEAIKKTMAHIKKNK